ELVESEIFGHEKGAFTGAVGAREGKFEVADGGTLFLDEIGDMKLETQAKILRVLQEKEFERVGGTQTIKADVKIIAATNLEMEKAIEEGTFREDLFYRLNIIPIVLPPLRERKDDIPLLVEHFIRKTCRDLGVENKRLGPGVLDLFMEYHWPGNIRELEASLHRAIVMSPDETMTRDDFYNVHPPAALPGQTLANDRAPMFSPLEAEVTGEIYDEVMASVDRQLILRALDNSGGRIREAARRLGLARNTLKSKIQKYGISVKD
ncbi:MAG TPA: sigma-54 dependent transcriptional regulator, partial [Thermoanaerobaculia bacterium]